MTRLIYAPHHRLENQHTRRGPLPGTSHLSDSSRGSELAQSARVNSHEKFTRLEQRTDPAPRKSGLPVCATLYYLYSTMSHLSTHGGARFSFLLRSVSLALGLGSRARHSRHTHLVCGPTATRDTGHTRQAHCQREVEERRRKGGGSSKPAATRLYDVVVYTRRGRYTTWSSFFRRPPRR